MVRFLHTADWQFGMRAREIARAGDLRRARLETLARVGRVAGERGVAFVLLAGDVFEDNQVDNQLVHEVLRELERFPCAVFILPGNHDHLGPASVYSRPAFGRLGPQVRVLAEPAPVEVAGGAAALLPAPLRQRASRDDPTQMMQAQETPSEAMRIGVGHGSLRIEGKYQPDDFPIALDATARARLDYLALGHWHSFYDHDGRTVYSGTPEPTKFGEDGSGTVSLVEIAGPGAPARLERIPVAKLRWEKWAEAVARDPAELLAAWRRRIEGTSDADQMVLRLAPAGVAPASFRGLVDELADWAAARVFHLDVRLEGVRPAPDDATLRDRCGAHPLLAGMASDLDAISAIADPAGAGADVDSRAIAAFAGPAGEGDHAAARPAPLARDTLRQQLGALGGDAALAAEARYLFAELLEEVTR